MNALLFFCGVLVGIWLSASAAIIYFMEFVKGEYYEKNS